MTEQTKSNVLDFNDLLFSASCEAPYEFEYLIGGKKPSGFFIKVLGSESRTVKHAIRDKADAIRFEDKTKELNDPTYVRSTHDEARLNDEMVALRVVGWRGISKAFSQNAAIELIENNSEIRDQVLAESNKLGNFIKI